MHSKEAGSLFALLKYKRSVLIVMGLTMGGSLYFYTFTMLQPIFGALSDRIGRRSNMLLFSGLATLASVPLLVALGQVSSPYAAFALALAALVIASFYTSVSGVVKAEVFPSTVRCLGVGFTYAVGNAHGGTAEFVALSLKGAGHEGWFPWYVTALVGVAFMAPLMLPDSRRSCCLDGTWKE